MNRWLALCVVLFFSHALHAQLLTWTPPFPKESDPSQSLEIIVDATKGNQGLLNHTPVSDVYVHIGVITSLSTSGTDWRHVKFTWATTPPEANAVSLGGNKWKFTINGSLRTFFDITDASETIKKIAILFRSGNGNNVERNSDESDMYIPVYGNGLNVRIDAPPSEPKYFRVAEQQSWSVGNVFTMTSNASAPSQIKHYFNNQPASVSPPSVTTYSSSFTITQEGQQVLISEASDGTTTTYDTLKFFVSPPASPTAALPAGVRDGINYEPGDTSVTLVLRAPGKNLVTVIGEFNNWSQQVMNRTPDGKFFWIRVHPLLPGTEYAYQYIVDASIKIADPYAEKILDPSGDQFIPASVYPGLKSYPAGQSGIVSVLQTAAPTYTWTTSSFSRPDKRGLVIYELLVRDFVAAHDWKTVTDSLNYLKNLGINAIEVMPVNEFEGNSSWGYNPDFYFAPDKYYGPKNTMKAFIDSCHKKGIAVIMDIALNHSFGQSPMVQLYWDAANNRPAANNPWFNPVPKHPFNVGYDMNHESADTKYFVSRVVEQWLQQYRIDGFRFDLSKGFTQFPSCDANGNNCDANLMAAYDASRVAIWKGYYDTVQLKSNGSYAILEHFADVTEERELADYGMLLWGNMNFNYSQALKGSGGSNSDFSNGIWSVRNFPKPHLVTYMESHDEERITYLNITGGAASGNYNIRDTATALKRMEMGAAFFLTIPGPKMIWQFGELGYDYPINYCTNGTINNSCRLDPKPIRWDYFNESRRRSVYNTYSKLNALRNHPWYRNAFFNGTTDRSLSGDIKWIKVNSGDTSQLLVVGNFAVSAVSGSVVFPSAGTWFDYFTNETITASGTSQIIGLLPGEFHVYLNRNVNNVAITPVPDIPWDHTSLQAKVYPNPAVSDFTLALQLPQNGNVRIVMYNTMGQYMETLYNSFLSKGEHQVFLKNNKAVKGNYYLQVKAGSKTKTVKVNFQ
jgi:1,4-alpha-glucan branching enzyme